MLTRFARAASSGIAVIFIISIFRGLWITFCKSRHYWLLALIALPLMGDGYMAYATRYDLNRHILFLAPLMFALAIQGLPRLSEVEQKFASVNA